MSDTRGLLDRISAFRQRLEAAPQLVADPAAAQPEVPTAALSEPEAFRHSLRQIAGTPVINEGPVPTQFTARAHRLLQAARELLDRQRKFAADPVIAGLCKQTGPDADPLAAFHQETVAVMDSAIRLAQVLPDSPTAQLRLCDGLDGVLAVVRERLGVQERALARRKADLGRIDRLAAVFAAMNTMRAVNLSVVAALAEELIEDARQTRPLRFLYAHPEATTGYPGGFALPAPARFVAAHALNVGGVIARVVGYDYEWAGRPLLPVVAALLMDCGMMAVPAAVLAKAGPLTPDEERLVESHPQRSAEWVVRYMPDAAALADAIATHHERTDGTGYPVGLKADAVPSLSRMLAAADTYAALCAPRPHRPAQDTRSALTDTLLLADYGQLDRDFAEYLLHLSFYPVGSVVELTDGRVGVVAANHPNRMDPRSPGRPVIAVLTEPDGSLLPRPEHLDLSASDRGGILRTLPADRRRELLGSRYPDLV